MFNIKCTYLKVVLHGNSDLSESYKIYCTAQYKRKLHLTKCIYRSCNMEFNHNTKVVGSSHLRPVAPFEIILLVFQFLCSVLG